MASGSDAKGWSANEQTMKMGPSDVEDATQSSHAISSESGERVESDLGEGGNDLDAADDEAGCSSSSSSNMAITSGSSSSRRPNTHVIPWLQEKSTENVVRS